MANQPKSFEGLASRDLPHPGEVLGDKYAIERTLGVGGMAVVFAATHLALGQKVAIKFLLPTLSADAGVVDRFMREGRAVARIRSEHVVRVFDVDEGGGRPYLVLEYLEGEDLGSIVAAGPQPIARAVDLVLQACEGLAEAHASGVIHRDLKPSNLFLSHRADGSSCVKVLDFGISKIVKVPGRDSGFRALGTLPMTVMGSPNYMSPEQIASAADVDERADIWSMGAILHELLTGKPAFDCDTITALCARILNDPPAPLRSERPDAPTALEAVVLRCLEKERSCRFGNVAELSRALVGFGSPEAHGSAERIGRIVEGGIALTASPAPRIEGAKETPAPSQRRRAADLLEPVPQLPMRRPVGAYVFLALSVCGLGGSIGWKVTSHGRAIRDAEQRTLATPPAPATVPALAPTPSSVTSTTGVVLATPRDVAPPPPPPTPAAAANASAAPPQVSAPPAVTPHASSPAHQAGHGAGTATTKARRVAEDQDDDPFGLSFPAPAASAPPVPRPALFPPAPLSPTPPTPSTTTPEELFEDRK